MKTNKNNKRAGICTRANSVSLSRWLGVFAHRLHIRWKMIKSFFTNVVPDYETMVALHGQKFADNIIGQIENNVRKLRSEGITKLYCPECNDGGKELFDPDSPEYIAKREEERASVLGKNA